MKEKNLIAIFTCNRLFYLKWFLADYLAFCNQNPYFDLVVSLDGDDKSYIEFCKENKIPLIWSKERLGVGISKNRVLESFPEYDSYFFLDDDAELLNPEVFNIIIRLAQKTGIPHFSLGAGFGFKGKTGDLEADGFKIQQTQYGSGQFSFFSGEALRQVGGWHPLFAKYKRGGHTEHSYRFYHAQLSESPFHFIRELNNGYMNWHSPEHVTNLVNIKTSKNSRLEDEENLINKKLTTHPIITMSNYHTPQVSLNIQRDDFSFHEEVSSNIILKIIEHPFFDSREKLKALNMYFQEKDDVIQDQKKELEEKRYLLDLIKNSGTYKIAQGISKPVSLCRKIISE